ncbi:MAG: hypothetical protein ACRD3E_09820 [Terriglobales bacterium]
MPNDDFSLTQLADLIEAQLEPTDREEFRRIRAANPSEPSDLAPFPAKSDPPKDLEIQSPLPPESVEPTPRDRLSAARRARRCHHVKSNGLRCGSPALHDRIYCYFHELWRAQPECVPHRPDPNGALYKLPLLEDANAIQLAIQQVLDALLANKLELRRGMALLYGLQTAAVNSKRTTFDPIAYRSEIITELK